VKAEGLNIYVKDADRRRHEQVNAVDIRPGDEVLNMYS